MITEDVNDTGPTGRFRRALLAEVVDYGGNVLGCATTDRGLRRICRRFARTPHQIRAVKLGALVKPSDVGEDEEIL